MFSLTQQKILYFGDRECLNIFPYNSFDFNSTFSGEATVGKRKEVILAPQIQNVFGPSTLAAGGHQQDFRFQLPPIAMPTSFEGKIGSIR